jgi:toxin FitB
MYLIDTNVISEIRKGRRCHAAVAAWYRATHDYELFLSVLSSGRFAKGVERLRPRNARQANALENWLEEILGSFGDRVFPINQRVAQIWGRFNAHKVLPVVDSLLAATA